MNLLQHVLIAATLVAPKQDAGAVDAILEGFESAWVVAIGENHGHQEFHDLIVAFSKIHGLRR